MAGPAWDTRWTGTVGSLAPSCVWVEACVGVQCAPLSPLSFLQGGVQTPVGRRGAEVTSGALGAFLAVV